MDIIKSYLIAYSLDLAKGCFLSASGKNFDEIKATSGRRNYIIWNCGIRHDGGHSSDARQ